MVPKGTHEKVDSIRERAKTKLERDLGKDLLDKLYDPDITDLYLNADGNVWIKSKKEGKQKAGYLRPAQGKAIIETVAGFHGEEVTRYSPSIEGEFPLDDSRFSGQIGSIVLGPVFTIRKKAVSIYTLDQYVEEEIMTEKQRDEIKKAVKNKENIIVAGACGAGKTTLTNAIIHEITNTNPSDRIISIEDRRELQICAEDKIEYNVSNLIDPKDGLPFSMMKLLKITLSMEPNRIIVGEVRDHVALYMLMAWNTGHGGGVCTLHANNAKDALERIIEMVSLTDFMPSKLEQMIARAVQLVVSIDKRGGEGRKVRELLKVRGFKDNNFELEYI